MKHRILICLIFLLSSCQTNKDIPTGLPTNWEHPFCLASFQTGVDTTKKLYFTKYKLRQILVHMKDDKKPIQPSIATHLMMQQDSLDTTNWQELKYVYYSSSKEFCISSKKLDGIRIKATEVKNNNNDEENKKEHPNEKDFFPNRKIFYDLKEDATKNIEEQLNQKKKSSDPKMMKLLSITKTIPSQKFEDIKTLELKDVHHRQLVPFCTLCDPTRQRWMETLLQVRFLFRMGRFTGLIT